MSDGIAYGLYFLAILAFIVFSWTAITLRNLHETLQDIKRELARIANTL